MAHPSAVYSAFVDCAIISYMVKQVVDWSGRCHAAVKDVQEYIQRGSGAGLQT